MPPTVMAGDALARGILSNFVGTLNKRNENYSADMKGIVSLGEDGGGQLIPMFGYPESAPMPQMVPWGEAGTSKTFRYRTFTAETLRWKTNVRWLRMHRTANQLDDILKNADKAADRWGDLNDLIVSEILRETAGQLGAVLTAPDGVGIFSDVDGAGAARFGVTGGNTMSGQSFSSPVGLQDAVFRCIERMQQFQDTQGQPFHPVIKNVTVIIPAQFAQIATQAFDAAFTPTGTNAQTSQSSVSNPFQAGGYVIKVISSSRFTETTRIMVAVGDYAEAPIRQTVLMAPEHLFFDGSNSYQHATAGLEETQIEMWMAWVLGLPISIQEATT